MAPVGLHKVQIPVVSQVSNPCSIYSETVVMLHDKDLCILEENQEIYVYGMCVCVHVCAHVCVCATVSQRFISLNSN